MIAAGNAHVVALSCASKNFLNQLEAACFLFFLLLHDHTRFCVFHCFLLSPVTGEVFTWGLGLLGAVGHGHSVHDELASSAQSSRIVSDGSNAAKALATPTAVRALSGIRVSQVVSSQHATYAIVAGARLMRS